MPLVIGQMPPAQLIHSGIQEPCQVVHDKGNALTLQPTPEAQSLLAQDPTPPCLLQYHMPVELSLRTCTGHSLMGGIKTFRARRLARNTNKQNDVEESCCWKPKSSDLHLP